MTEDMNWNWSAILPILLLLMLEVKSTCILGTLLVVMALRTVYWDRVHG